MRFRRPGIEATGPSSAVSTGCSIGWRLSTPRSGGSGCSWRSRSASASCRLSPTRSRYLVAKGVRDISLAAAFGQTGWRAGDIDGLKRQFARITALMRRERRTTGTVPVTLYRRRQDEAVLSPGRSPCSGALGDAIAVAPTGQAFGCSMLAGARPVTSDAVDAAGTDGRSGAASPALVLDRQSPLWRFALGDVRAPAFARRLETYSRAVLRSGMFERRREQVLKLRALRRLPLHRAVLGLPGRLRFRAAGARCEPRVRLRVCVQPCGVSRRREASRRADRLAPRRTSSAPSCSGPRTSRTGLTIPPTATLPATVATAGAQSVLKSNARERASAGQAPARSPATVRPQWELQRRTLGVVRRALV